MKNEKITENDCHIDNDGFIYCKDIPLNITRESLIDFEFQTGFHRIELIKSLYFGSVVFKRNKQLEELGIN